MKSLWRHFPLAIVAGLGLVVVVNAALVYAALRTSPGKSGEGFALSNRYDTVLAAQAREAGFGLQMSAHADAERRPVVILTGPDGAPLHGARLAGIAQRPLGGPETRSLAFLEGEAGRYIADAALPMPGQWEITLSVSASGHDVAATRRVIVH